MPNQTFTELDLMNITPPFVGLPEAAKREIAATLTEMSYVAGSTIYSAGETLAGLYLIGKGEVEITDPLGAPLSHLRAGNQFAERGLRRDGNAVTAARAKTDVILYCLPAEAFAQLCAVHPDAAAFYARVAPTGPKKRDLATMPVSDLMSAAPISCAPETSLQDAAAQMRAARVSSLIVTSKGVLSGIVTTKDMTYKALAEALPATTPISRILTLGPLTLTPTALVSDALHMMLERKISHLPIVDGKGRPVGIITQTDLTRYQALSTGQLISDIVRAGSAEDMAKSVAQIPALLAQLVGANTEHTTVTRLITDIADAATRRLLALAEENLGAPPVPYLWVACGSQGRQEQTGVSDQDNCLILDDNVTPEHDAYFKALATLVCDGLNTCGYVYCPGDMMATADRWRQPLRIWKGYFQKWIATPNEEAQMLASVMFDLRPIGGDGRLLEALLDASLPAAKANSIFVAQMISNSLKHTPPLGLLRGLATIRSGEHKNTLDLKHNGVVPVVDLGRVYALLGQMRVVNTGARLMAAADARLISPSGAKDLRDAYDMIAESRLLHQAAQIKRGTAPDNFMSPEHLSDLERSHLRDAFVVVKTMQSALQSGRGLVQ
jgi:CBS domain-containing protein